MLLEALQIRQTNSKMIKELGFKNLYSYKFIYIIKKY